MINENLDHDSDFKFVLLLYTSLVLIRHKTLQLALSIVSAINQGSINAYFLRRDLFSTLAGVRRVPLYFGTIA